MLVPLSEPQLPHLLNGHNDGPHLRGKWGGLDQIRIKCTEGYWAQEGPEGLQAFSTDRTPRAPGSSGRPRLWSQAWDFTGMDTGTGSIGRSQLGVRGLWVEPPSEKGALGQGLHPGT